VKVIGMFAIGKTRTGMKTAVCSAISSRRLVEFYYRGGVRLVEPFCLGEIGPGDEGTLLCYQVSGYTRFGEPVGWKLYRFSEISKLEVVNENFTGTRPGYDPGNLEMTTVYCCVSTVADEETQPEETAGPVLAGSAANLSYEEAEDSAVPCQKHDELMKRSHLSHSIPPVSAVAEDGAISGRERVVIHENNMKMRSRIRQVSLAIHKKVTRGITRGGWLVWRRG